MSKIGQFFRESKAELKKVVWPTRDDVVSSIKVVIILRFLVPRNTLSVILMLSGPLILITAIAPPTFVATAQMVSFIEY